MCDEYAQKVKYMILGCFFFVFQFHKCCIQLRYSVVNYQQYFSEINILSLCILHYITCVYYNDSKLLKFQRDFKETVKQILGTQTSNTYLCQVFIIGKLRFSARGKNYLQVAAISILQSIKKDRQVLSLAFSKPFSVFLSS